MFEPEINNNKLDNITMDLIMDKAKEFTNSHKRMRFRTTMALMIITQTYQMVESLN